MYPKYTKMNILMQILFINKKQYSKGFNEIEVSKLVMISNSPDHSPKQRIL